MNLKQYLDETGESQASFAARLGKSPPVLSRYIAGEYVLDVITAHKIETMTQRKVPMAEWVQARRDYLEQLSRAAASSAVTA